MIRNLQRRSKKWRRSTEEKSKRESTGEAESASTSKENNSIPDCLEDNKTVLCQRKLEDENANVNVISTDLKKSETPPCSPATKSVRKNAVVFHSRPRPVSLGFPPNFQLVEPEIKLREKVLSDPSMTKETSLNSSDVWIPRPNLSTARRRTSRLSVCSRNSSVFSDDTSPLSGSKKSLSHISQDSLADSGVAETPGSSPCNTLAIRTRKRSTPERGEKLSRSLSNVCGSSETKRKLSHLDRRSWGDWISAEMENADNEVAIEKDDHVDDGVGVKNKRKFKDVVKQLFFSKKK